MNEFHLIGLAGIIILGVGAQWLAWRLHLPSILLLLLVGIVAGPVTGFIDPDILLGNVLFPTVSVSVAIILFEGGLSLKFSELRAVGGVVRNLVTIGALVTWGLASIASVLLLGLSVSMSILLGAILIVSGPTVVLPLLRSVRTTPAVSSILRWECIVIDPIGALLAVLVFEGILISAFTGVTTLVLSGVVKTAVIGGAIGVSAALVMVFLLKRFWIPDFLQETVTLMMVIAAFMASNSFQAESGLLATTIMGIVLANQKRIPVRHIVKFKENLRVLLLAILFILLASRLTSKDLEILNVGSLIFLAFLILIVRPVAVALSTIGSNMSWRERAYISWIAPRGIVAAAVSSIFAIRLIEAGYPEGEYLVSITFLVIIGTVALYSLTALPMARWLKVSRKPSQGVLISDAHIAAREIGRALQEEGVPVLLVDRDWFNVKTARMEGLQAQYGNVLSDRWLERMEIDGKLEGIGRLLALTPNDEKNSLTRLHFEEMFGRKEIYQLSTESEGESNGEEAISLHLRGRFLFDPNVTYSVLRQRFASGAIIKKHTITGEFGTDELRDLYGSSAIPLFLVGEEGVVEVVTSDNPPQIEEGKTLISLVDPSNAQGDGDKPVHR
jgi:NhaP-type Na+/H+ or K+/H+ antiporter